MNIKKKRLSGIFSHGDISMEYAIYKSKYLNLCNKAIQFVGDILRIFFMYILLKIIKLYICRKGIDFCQKNIIWKEHLLEKI